MATILKVFLSLITLSLCVYGINIFGFSLWPLLFSGLSIFLLVSISLPQLDVAANVIARVMGGLSLIAFVLLLLASTIGGPTHMSESNQIISVGLCLMALFGCSFFLIKNTLPDKP